MKKVAVLVVVVLILGLVVLAAVTRPPRLTYRPDGIEILSEGVTGRGVVLTFRTPSEPGYYCPGARYRTEGSTIHYELVRAPEADQPAVDVKATVEKDGSLSVTFPFPGAEWKTGDVVELVDSAGNHHGR